MTMTKEEKQFYQMTCLMTERQEALTKRILNDPRDVSHDFYCRVFADFDWSAYEAEKTKASREIDSNCTMRGN